MAQTGERPSPEWGEELLAGAYWVEFGTKAQQVSTVLTAAILTVFNIRGHEIAQFGGIKQFKIGGNFEGFPSYILMTVHFFVFFCYSA